MRPVAPCLKVVGNRRHFNPVTCGRRHCTSCGRWRHITDFGVKQGRPQHVCHVCRARELRRTYRGLTPQQRERRREYDRIYRNVRRRAAGKPERIRHYAVKPYERLFFDVGPLLAELRRYELAGGSLHELALRSGVPQRSIYRYRVGESLHVSIDLADRLALALGLTLVGIYGDTSPVTLGPGHERVHEELAA